MDSKANISADEIENISFLKEMQVMHCLPTKVLRNILCSLSVLRLYDTNDSAAPNFSSIPVKFPVF